MRWSRTQSAVVCLALAALSRVACAQGTSPSQAAKGIVFVIDTTVITRNIADPSRPDAAAPTYRAFQSYTARVSYARGHGRIDILTVRPGAVLLADSATLTAPLGGSGEYYLFDSTSFVLVRPATKTFSRATISHEYVGGYEDREGWPPFFEFKRTRFDTVASTSVPEWQPRRFINLYWHTDSGATGFARGSTAIDNVPLQELNVGRWFGPTRWLARMVDSGGAPPKQLTVTVAVPYRPPNADGVPLSFILTQRFADVEVREVDLAIFAVPRGYSEAPWSGRTRP